MFIKDREEKRGTEKRNATQSFRGQKVLNIDCGSIKNLSSLLKEKEIFIKHNCLYTLKRSLSSSELYLPKKYRGSFLPVEISVYYCDQIQSLTQFLITCGKGTNQSIQHHIIRDFFGVGHKIRDEYPYVEFEKKLEEFRFDLIFYKDNPSERRVKREEQYRVEVKTIATMEPFETIRSYYVEYLQRVDVSGYPLYDALWCFFFLSNDNLDPKKSQDCSPQVPYCGQYLLVLISLNFTDEGKPVFPYYDDSTWFGLISSLKTNLAYELIDMSDESVKEVASTLKQDPSSFSILQNIILVSDLKKENEELRRKNEEWKILYGVIENENEDLKSAYEKIEKENKELRTAYDELKGSYGKIEKENKELRTAYDELKGSYEKIEKENKELRTAYDELKGSYEKIEKENKELRTAYEKIEKENKDLRREIEELKKMMKKLMKKK